MRLINLFLITILQYLMKPERLQNKNLEFGLYDLRE